jgi:hypothetical protein
MPAKRTYFEPEEMKVFEPAEKIGIVATINPEDRIHLTLITSIMAPGPTLVTIGQFCMGRSKWYMQQKKDIAFLIMSQEKKMWRGKARWTHKRTEGPEYEVYNNLPMFRYNTYFGINTVHYLDLVEIAPGENLPLGKIIPAAVMTRISKSSLRTGRPKRMLKHLGEALFNDLGALKFIAYLGTDGFPVIIPAIQAQAADSSRIAFSTFAYRDELETLQPEMPVSVFCVNLKMQSVLVRGTFRGFRQKRMIKTGVIDLDWVYNSMPPCHDQIYPELPLEAVVTF